MNATNATAPDAATTAEKPAKPERTLTGRVTSNKMDKTVTVLVERRVRHPVYGKYLVRSTKLHAHDETNQINEGDLVEISETRPLSRTKTWTVKRVVTPARS
jgi:small subunit ribosomal protein S17